MKIKTSDKILLIAPHPDDEVIACGGFIAKYHNQIDVLCINSSGVKYETDTLSAEEIADIRCQEFEKTMCLAGVNDFDITKIYGIPPMIEKIKKHFPHYCTRFDFKKYDIILIPHKNDNHIEHKYVGNVLLKKIFKKTGYKKSLMIMRYELWAPMEEPNYFEDISAYTAKKEEFINSYKSRSKSHYFERIIALNKYRTLNSFFFDADKFVEAFYVEPIQNYMYPPYLRWLFSVSETNNGITERKVITIFGIKIKFKKSLGRG